MIELDDEVLLSKGTEHAHQHIFDICRRALEGWGGLQQEQVQFSAISGGISNILVKVAPSAPGLSPVAVKVFGDKTELLVDRTAERVVVRDLSHQGFGPKVLVMFANGRVEQFLPCLTLTPPHMCDPRFVPRIAALVRRFHAAAVALPPEPTLWPVINGWLRQARDLAFDDAAKAAAHAALDFGAMEAEAAALQRLCDAMGSPVVFGHNDLLSGNILVLQQQQQQQQQQHAAAPAGCHHHQQHQQQQEPPADDWDGPLQLIDFEYGAHTYRGFDIANHFNEYAGFECDYNRYPAREHQRLFFEHYLADPGAPPAAAAAAAADGGGGGALPPLPRRVLSEAELDRLCAEVDLFSLASHMYWGVWALVQARYSPIDFDYMDYSRMRWAEYYRRKEACMGAARAALEAGTAQP